MAAEGKDHIAESLLKRAHPPDTASTIFREKVRQRPLILRPTSPDPNRDARSKRQYERHQKAKAQRKSKKPKPLSAKQKRALGVYEIPKSQQKYTIYVPLHKMWCSYIREILGLNTGTKSWIDANGAGPMLVSADYHGAMVEVVRSRCVSRVGLKGIVVKDTKFTFEVVTVRDEVKTVPKEFTVFRFEVPLEAGGDGAKGESGESDGSGEAREGRRPLVFELHGGQFETRAPDRANKKVKAHYDPDL